MIGKILLATHLMPFFAHSEQSAAPRSGLSHFTRLSDKGNKDVSFGLRMKIELQQLPESATVTCTVVVQPESRQQRASKEGAGNLI